MSKPNETTKATTETKENEEVQKPVGKDPKPFTLSDRADSIIRDMTSAYHSGLNGSQLRNHLNFKVGAAADVIDPNDKKEFAKILREKIERLRQFAEVCYSEAVNITGQQGW